jgi:hypothetical protein
MRAEYFVSIVNVNGYSLESAGDGGLLIVSGLMQSEGDGDLSRFVTVPRPSERPWPFVVPLTILVEWPR